MQRIRNQAAHTAVKVNGSIFEIVYRRLVPQPWICTSHRRHCPRLCRLIWIILNLRVGYEERGQPRAKFKATRTAKMIRDLRLLSYRVEPVIVQPANPA